MSADIGTNVHSFLQRVHALPAAQDNSLASTETPENDGQGEEISAIYDEWAKTYNVDVRHAGIDYVGPVNTAQAAVDAGGNLTGSVLDAGCGTGLVGVALSQLGAKTIDGMDISPGMLEVASKSGAYKDLTVADMTKNIDKPDQTYDVITCCGTFTAGHVGPVPALRELVRMTKKGGLIVTTILNEVWVSGSYEAEVERLATVGAVDIVSTEEAEYRRGTNSKARMVILRRL